MKIIVDNKIPYIKGILEPFADVEYYAPADINREVVCDADILIIRTRTRCNRELLEGSKVRYIGTATIGYDHIDTEWCGKNGIVWTNAPGCNASSVGQYILSSLLSLQERKDFVLEGKVIGIVGVGNVGRIVADYCRMVGMEVLLNDPPRARLEDSTCFVSLDEVAKECDIITFHTPMNKSGMDCTYHLAGADFFSRLRKRPVIINSSRGEVVDNRALYNAYQSGNVSEMILDCWENEPDVDDVLLSNVFIGTPHIAGYSADGKANATRQIVQAISRWMGISIDTSLIQPPAPVFPDIDLSLCSDNILASAVLATYDPRNDTAALRAAPGTFEKLRGEYGLRREFNAYTVHHAVSRDIELLQKLGFQVS